jgi:hypothetical protein
MKTNEMNVRCNFTVRRVLGIACSLRVAFRALSEDGSPAGWRGCNPCGNYLGGALPYIWTGNLNGLHTAARGWAGTPGASRRQRPK